ncbi:hypothetical protein BBD42_26200 [Paenibacillus sp. BIHB 4019]|uniref:DUF1877 domain-containing protein n=1 Tax=Paenibacillus sp. BIHB 4019 TaxID=1870819 RepID=A0A1B2DPH1_9BACL|nr:YfbM family protein [Paenibacillus sp. BIHB 4019]ANY69587.1 hypothetical protein BBD42_26200 [Paenibacillus sp. BIHB 4019]
MGMIGIYLAVYNEQIEQIAQGELLMEEMAPDAFGKLDIDKAWQAIHYVLCEEIDNGSPPIGYVVPMLDDQALDFSEFGAFYLNHKQVTEASIAISAISEAGFRERYSLAALVENAIYPVGSDEDEQEFFDYIYANFVEIGLFYSKAATEGKGIIFYIS